MVMDFTDDKSNTVSGNGLVPSGNKPLPEPVLTQIYVATRPQWVNKKDLSKSLILEKTWKKTDDGLALLSSKTCLGI